MAKKNDKHRIVITGIGIISPVGIGIPAFQDSIFNGKSGIKKIHSFDPSKFPCQIAGEISDFDPMQYIHSSKIPKGRSVQFAVAAAKMATEDADLKLNIREKERTGVIIGTSSSGIGYLEIEHNRFLEKGRVSPYATTGVFAGSVSSEVASHLGIHGLNFTLSNGCTAATDAIGYATQLIRESTLDIVVAGGSEAPITPLIFSGFCSMRAVSTKKNKNPEAASRPFDANRDGMVLSEGAGVFVIEELGHALKRKAPIYAEIIGYAATSDSYHITHPAKEGIQAARAMNLALEDANIFPEKIDCINAHGTSTIINDKIETKAIKRVFGNYAYKVPINAIKSMTGHSIGASGGMEVAAILLEMKQGIISPTINLQNPDHECDLDYVPNKAIKKKHNIVMKNSFGFGGRNSSLILLNGDY